MVITVPAVPERSMYWDHMDGDSWPIVKTLKTPAPQDLVEPINTNANRKCV